MCVYVCVCVCVCALKWICVHTYVCECVSMFVFVCVSMFVFVCVYTNSTRSGLYTFIILSCPLHQLLVVSSSVTQSPNWLHQCLSITEYILYQCWFLQDLTMRQSAVDCNRLWTVIGDMASRCGYCIHGNICTIFPFL